MSFPTRFFLDKEKDIAVNLEMRSGRLFYTLKTPNHGTGNLITNLAALCSLPRERDENGLLVIEDEIPCFVDADNRSVYVLRLADTKVANIYEDGTVERKAYIPAIAKTLMSQTKDYALDARKTLVKTYIRKEVKFCTDLHTHRSANLSPDLLIALGIHHQLRYPYYYVKKLGLRLTSEQKDKLEAQRNTVAERYRCSGLTGKYLDRKIDDNTEINFAELILGNIGDSEYNISKIRASLAVMKDGQAVFTNLEKVYLYRYVFTKGVPAAQRTELPGCDGLVNSIPDRDIVHALRQMEKDRKNGSYKDNTLFQDTLLWVARSYRKQGVRYAEISDTALVKPAEAAYTLQQIHDVMPAVTKETGVTLRFLAAIRRIPLTIVKDRVDRGDYFKDNLRVLKAVATDPYVSGSDIVGEELNDIRELRSVIARIVSIAKDIPSFAIRIHAGENDALPSNVLNSILCVENALAPGQVFPHLRVGHGLYTEKLTSVKGQMLLEKLRKYGSVLEFQISSNVRLNNLSTMENHPLKQYLEAGVFCVQGTDGGALYGTDPIDEQLSLERMLDLSMDDMARMHEAELRVLRVGMQAQEEKTVSFRKEMEEYLRANDIPGTDAPVSAYLQARIAEEMSSGVDISTGIRHLDSSEVLKDRIKELPADMIPIVIAGGSFNHANRVTKVSSFGKGFLDRLLEEADPQKVFFVIGPSMTGYEKYLSDKAGGRFDVFTFVPSVITESEEKKILSSGVSVRVSIESTPLGVYKSFAFEIFKRRQSVIVALDGNAAAANLIQDAKNSRYKSRTFISNRSAFLRTKARSLQGYVTMLDSSDTAEEVLHYAEKYYEALGDNMSQML